MFKTRRELTVLTPEELELVKSHIRTQLITTLDPDVFMVEEGDADKMAATRQHVRQSVERVLKTQWKDSRLADTQERLVTELVNEIAGLGPIEGLLKDQTISEIMINGPREIYIERAGKLERLQMSFRDREQLMYFIERVLAPFGRRVTESEPFVDARLMDGSRVNVVIEPAAVGGPFLTIRKHSQSAMTMDRLVTLGTITPPAASLLAACVRARHNMVLSGPAGAGKTTALNVLINLIPADERLIVIEDTAELQVAPRHVVRLETRLPNVEGRGEITIRDLLKNTLHMRPDRIIVGEVRGGEALDMLQAMNTGHDGSLTTLHANSPVDALSRIVTMALMASIDLSNQAIERQTRSAVDLVVHLDHFADGSRKITRIAEMLKSDATELHQSLQDVFVFEQHGVSPQGHILGALVPTGTPPSFLQRFIELGITLDPAIFRKPAKT